jgi:bacitracin synthase 1
LKNVRGIGEYVKLASGKDKFIAIQPGEEKEYYPLSPSQNRFYFLYQIDPGSTVYNIFEALVFEGDVDPEKLEKTFLKLIARHDSLRASFPVVGKDPVLRIRKHVDFSVQYHDLRGQEQEKIIRGFVEPFDLKIAPLMRIRLVKTAEKTHLCLFDIHHIIFDLVSMEVFVKEFITFYTGKEETLPVLKLQYKDYSEWQNQLVLAGEIKKQENFWLNEFSNCPPVLNIATDYERPKIQSFEGENIIFEISAGESAALKEYAAQEETTMFVVMIAIFYIFLGKLSNEEDIVIGTPTAGRRYVELFGVVGLFINTLALRNYPKGEKTFLEFLGEVKHRTLEAFDNQDYQFEDLVRNIKIKRDEMRNPLYDVLFTYRWERADTLGPIDSHLNIKKLDIKQTQIMLDLVLVVNELERSPQLYISIGYCSKLFKKETVEQFITHFKQIVSSVVKDKHIRIDDIKITHALGMAQSDAPQIDFAF